MTVWAMGVAGQIVRQYTEADEKPLLPEGWVAVAVDEADPQHRMPSDGDAIEREPVSLLRRQNLRWESARAYREAYATGGCPTALGRVDTDETSRQKISGAVQMAMVAVMGGAVFDPIAWTMSDNSVVLHDAPAMIAMGVTVGRFINACQQAGTAIRVAIYASDTPETIDITAGYPAQEEF